MRFRCLCVLWRERSNLTVIPSVNSGQALSLPIGGRRISVGPNCYIAKLFMKFKTAITKVNAGDEIIRGEKLTTLIKERNFGEVVYLALMGRLPNAQEARQINAVLTSMIDHGPGTNSAMATRIVSSAGNSLHTAVAAGILSLGGFRHGGALEGAAKFFQENLKTSDVPELLKSMKDKKMRVPGFGHKVLTHDNRTGRLFDVAKECGFFKEHCAFALKVDEELQKISSKAVPLNMDGANAAILSDMGFPWQIVLGFFIIGRVSGLVAHAYEEMNSGEGIRRLDESEIEYVGRK